MLITRCDDIKIMEISYLSSQVTRTKKQLELMKSATPNISNDDEEIHDDSCSCGTPFNYEKAKTKRIYDKISNSYDEKVEFDEWLTGVDRLRKKLMLHVSGDVLEIAAGSGRSLSE